MRVFKGKKDTEKKNGVGRPREHNREQIAIDMIVWASLDTSVNLNGFCCSYKPPIDPTKITQWAHEETEDGLQFRKAYNATKSFLAERRETNLNKGKLHVKAYDLNAKVYDHFLRQEYRDDIAYQIMLKAKEDSCNSVEDLARYNALMDQLSDLQKAQDARKRAENKIKAEEKS